MTLPLYVRTKPRWWRWVPWLRETANTIYPSIYLPDDVYEDLQCDNPSPYSEAILKHEEVHWQWQREMGIVRYGFRYIFSRRFRYQEELLAIRPQMAHLIQHGKIFDIEKRARALSGWEYLWCVTFRQAIEDLKKEMNL